MGKEQGISPERVKRSLKGTVLCEAERIFLLESFYYHCIELIQCDVEGRISPQNKCRKIEEMYSR